MLHDELLPALTYAVYATGWTYAPRLLSAIERVGHRLRDRALEVHRHVGVVDGKRITIRLVTWDAALRRDLGARIARRAHELEVVHEGSVRASAVDGPFGDTDLTFIEVPEFRTAPFLDGGFFLVPKRVAHVERLDRPDPALVSRVRAGIASRGLVATETRDPRALRAFARGVYQPFVRARHGSRGRPTPTLVLELVLARGRLIEVRERGEIIGGAVVANSMFSSDTLEIVVIASADAKDEVARTAPVVFARDVARREGKLFCDHLGSAPFLRDGVFLRKERYGTIPVDMNHRQDRIVVRIASTLAAQAFVAAEPFLVLSGGRLVDVRSCLAKVSP